MMNISGSENNTNLQSDKKTQSSTIKAAQELRSPEKPKLNSQSSIQHHVGSHFFTPYRKMSSKMKKST